MKYITKLNIWKTALLISFFEFFTLLLLPHLNFNPGVNGFIIGLLGAVLAILLFNYISHKGFKFKIEINKEKDILNKLEIVIPSIANGVFIALLFIVQEEISFSFRSQLINDALLGFFSVFIAMIGCIAIYNLLRNIIKSRIKIILNGKKVSIERIELLRGAFFVAIFEFFILPFMGLFFIIFQNLPQFIMFPLVGLFGGFIGTFFASIFYNLFAIKLKGIGFRVK